MITLTQKDGKTFAQITALTSWEKNPRGIKAKDFERLKEQIKKLGQYKPLLVTQEGIVLGGNMRLKAFQELGITEIWVSVVAPKTEAEMFEYALSDNDRAGYYEDAQLAELIQLYKVEIPLELYKVDLSFPLDLQRVLDSFGPVPGERGEDTGAVERSLEGYLNSAIRQIVLYFTVKEFESVIARLLVIRNELKVKDNTEVFVRLLNFYESNHAKA